ncbi:hypothetical protein COJ48_18790 [Bacillus cereus]|uniref:hypothetical protein n=1 Tax=Bacillus paramycoides TaxID=2026194 RepID=UPI000BF9E09A|nr:hypothetical protein COJ48_18790 [Bacillus cereus]
MDKTKKRNILILSFVVLAIICVTLFIQNRNEKNASKEKAAKVAIQHIKKEENVDLVVTAVTIEKIARAGFITVRGHAKDNNQKTFYVVINKTQNYSVAHWGKS